MHTTYREMNYTRYGFPGRDGARTPRAPIDTICALAVPDADVNPSVLRATVLGFI